MKKLLALLLSLVMVLCFVACNSSKEDTTTTTKAPETTTEAPKADLPESIVEIKKPDAGVITFADFSFKVNDKEIKNADLADLQVYKITCKSTNSKGVESEATYGGYLLTDVLTVAGVTEYSTVSVVANDGYAVDLAKADINEYTIVAIEKDKELGEDGTIWVIPTDQSLASNYCKLVVSMTTK